MRVSSAYLFERGVQNINNQQSQFGKLADQLASGKRILKPSDDAQGAAKAVALDQEINRQEQYAKTRVSVRNDLAQSESIISNVTDGVVRTKTLITKALNGVNNENDRKAIASEIEGIYEFMLGQANSKNGNNEYIFAGFNTGNAPFVKGVGGNVGYLGSTDTREARVDESRLIETGFNGFELFNTIQPGVGYITEPGNNTGDALVSQPEVINTSAFNFGDPFSIDFVSDAAGTRYTINGGAEVPYAEGQSIQFNGMTVNVEGQPADGDSFTVGRAEAFDQGLFEVMEDVIDVLRSPSGIQNETADIRNNLNMALRKLDNNFDNLLVSRASIGSRMNEIDNLDVVSQNQLVSLAETKSDLVDANLVEVISEYSLKQTGLTAAQRTFADIGKLSLFDYI